MSAFRCKSIPAAEVTHAFRAFFVAGFCPSGTFFRGDEQRGYYHAFLFHTPTEMPLSEPKCARTKAHTRRIVVDGFRREDGLFEVEALLEDVKPFDLPLLSGTRRAGEPLHHMQVRVTFDRAFTILDAEVCLNWVPYPGACEEIVPSYQQLIGLNLMDGFRRAVNTLFADVCGCSHMTELLQSLPTAAIHTIASFRREDDDDHGKPYQLDRCHALDTRTDNVRRYYPRWYRAHDDEAA